MDAPGGQNPYLGNGFVGKGENAIIPEYHLGAPVDGLKVGAEMWRIRPDGTESLVAVLRKEGWVRAVVD